MSSHRGEFPPRKLDGDEFSAGEHLSVDLKPGVRVQDLDTTVVQAGPSAADEGGLGEWWQAVVQRLHVVVGIAVAVTLVTGILALRLEPRYTTRATLELGNRSPNILGFRDMVEPESQWYGVYNEYRQTQIRILESRVLAAKVVRTYGLADNPLFMPVPEAPSRIREALGSARGWLRGLLPGTAPPEAELGAAEEPAELLGVPLPLVGRARAGLKVTAEPRTRLLAVSYTSADPELSALMANAFAEAYRQHLLDLKRELAGEARDFLRRELSEVEDRLREAEENLNAFRRENGLLGIRDGENTTVRKVMQLNEALADAQVSRIEFEAEYALVRSGELESLPAVLSSGIVSSLKAQYSGYEAEYGRLSQRLKPGYPRLDALHAQMRETQGALDREMLRISKGIELDFRTARRREQQLRSALDEIRAEALAEKDEFVTYQVLERDVETNRHLYNGLLQRFEETGIVAGVESSNVSMVDRAVTPRRPSYPNIKRLVLLGMIVGLGLGLGTALLLSLMDNALYTPEHASRYLKLATLGFVPDLGRNSAMLEAAHAKSPGAKVVTANGNGTDGSHDHGAMEDGLEHDLSDAGGLFRSAQAAHPAELAALDPDGNLVSEAFRIFRASLMLSSPGSAPRCIVLTSATKGEGKTMTAINTALVLAQSGMRGVILDADLRRPRVHRVAGIPNDRGLTSFLAGQAELGEIAYTALHENLYVVPAGPRAPNPSELLGSARMAETLAYLKERCDFVICDAPPVLPVADALLLAGFADGVVLVVDAVNTPKQLVRAARDKLLATRATILGVVLNRVPSQHSSRRYGVHSYYYNSYYRRYGDYDYEDRADSAA